jgi:hypothetical protein
MMILSEPNTGWGLVDVRPWSGIVVLKLLDAAYPASTASSSFSTILPRISRKKPEARLSPDRPVASSSPPTRLLAQLPAIRVASLCIVRSVSAYEYRTKH